MPPKTTASPNEAAQPRANSRSNQSILSSHLRAKPNRSRWVKTSEKEDRGLSAALSEEEEDEDEEKRRREDLGRGVGAKKRGSTTRLMFMGCVLRFDFLLPPGWAIGKIMPPEECVCWPSRLSRRGRTKKG